MHQAKPWLTSNMARVVRTYRASLLIEAVHSVAQRLGLYEHAPYGISACHLVVEKTHNENWVLQPTNWLAFYTT